MSISLDSIHDYVARAEGSVRVFYYSDEYRNQIAKLAEAAGLDEQKRGAFLYASHAVVLGIAPVKTFDDLVQFFRSELLLVGDQVKILAEQYWNTIYQQAKALTNKPQIQNPK